MVKIYGENKDKANYRMYDTESKEFTSVKRLTFKKQFSISKGYN